MEEQIETPYIIRGLVRNFSQTKQQDKFDRGCRSFVFKLSFARKTDTIAQIHSKRQASSSSPSHFPSRTLSLPFHFHDTSPLPPHSKTLTLSHPFPPLSLASNPPLTEPTISLSSPTKTVHQSKLSKSTTTTTTTKNPFPWRLQTPRN
jgi:hypothetical protein